MLLTKTKIHKQKHPIPKFLKKQATQKYNKTHTKNATTTNTQKANNNQIQKIQTHTHRMETNKNIINAHTQITQQIRLQATKQKNLKYLKRITTTKTKLKPSTNNYLKKTKTTRNLKEQLKQNCA